MDSMFIIFKGKPELFSILIVIILMIFVIILIYYRPVLSRFLLQKNKNKIKESSSLNTPINLNIDNANNVTHSDNFKKNIPNLDNDMNILNHENINRDEYIHIDEMNDLFIEFFKSYYSLEREIVKELKHKNISKDKDLEIIYAIINKMLDLVNDFYPNTSINIKLFTHMCNNCNEPVHSDNNECNHCKDEIAKDKKYLYTALRDTNNYKDEQRRNNEIYIISDSIDLDELKKEETTLNLSNENTKVDYAVNNIFNKLMLGMYQSKYYICSNLNYAKKNNEYYSTSRDYLEYYNSIAIFLIDNPTPNGGVTSPSGVLIFDNKDIEIFEDGFIKEIGGYFSLRLNFVLKELNFLSVQN